MTVAVTSAGSGPRHCEAELPQPILSTSGQKSVIEVYSQQQVATCEGLIAQGGAVAAAAITDTDSCRKAEVVLLAIGDALKMVEARRLELKKPITQTGKAIDEIASKLDKPLDSLKESLRTKIFAFRQAEREAKAKAEREASEKLRLERAAAEKAAREKAEAEAKALADVLGEPVVPAAPEPLPPPPPRPAAPPPEPSVVSQRMVPELEIVDASLIPYRIGERVLMIPDRDAIKAVLALNVEVPGARMISKPQLAMSGRRP